jgi:hypothetical protein
MKKNVFIVSAYPFNEIRMNILKECLKSLKHPDFDIILATNLPIQDKEVNELCDFILYDKQDIKSWADYGMILKDRGYWVTFPHFYAEIKFNNAYHYDIYRSIYLSTGLALSAGYEFFYYIEGDCELNQENIKDFLDLKNDALNKGKDMVFFKRDVDPNRIDGFEVEHFSTVIFGGKLKYFQDNMKLPITPEEWAKDEILIINAFELFFYYKFKHLIDNFSLYDISIQSKVKKIGKLRKTDEIWLSELLFFDENDSENAYCLAVNNNDVTAKIEIYVNNNLNQEFYLPPNYAHYLIYKITDIFNTTVKRVVYLDNQFYLSNEIYFDEKSLTNLKKTNIIKIGS